jgi:antitoxin (DNA-binding transcriptional repressor) of toxin-antitoxin stability system
VHHACTPAACCTLNTSQVYQDLQPTANFLHLAAAGRGLTAAWDAITRLDAAVNVVAWYYALSGINILLLLARCACQPYADAIAIVRRGRPVALVVALPRSQLRADSVAPCSWPRYWHLMPARPELSLTTAILPARAFTPARLLRHMDFQPRLGVITRSLRLALPDLLHFALVAGAVFVGYAMMAFLIFGSAIPQFSGFGAAVNTCFSMMLGDFGDVYAALRQLQGILVRRAVSSVMSTRLSPRVNEAAMLTREQPRGRTGMARRLLPASRH